MGIIPTEADGQGCIEGVYMTALVGLIMGSDSDWVTVEPTVEVLAEFGIPFEVGVVSAHRTPEKMLAYARAAQGNGLKCIIACAGGAAHLPGMVAAATPLPVIGIPRALDTLDGMDSLLSIVQMPAGVPVATVSIGGAKNAGLLAVRILGAGDPALLDQMAQYQEKMRLEVEEKDTPLRAGWLTLPLRACRIHLRAVLMLPGWCEQASLTTSASPPPYPARNIAAYHVNLILPHAVE